MRNFNMPSIPSLPSSSAKGKLIAGLVALVLFAIFIPMMFGINDAGQRTMVQYPSGTLKVQFEPGIYITFFGQETPYNDFITFDFDKGKATGGATLDQAGIAVRYQDGGTGTIYGKARFELPNTEEDMIALHKAFKTNNGVAYKLIKPVTEEAENLTAGLMSSEEAYAEKRGTFKEWSHDQLNKGPYKTKLKGERVTDDATGETVVRNIPVIIYNDKSLPMRHSSDLARYGITVSGYQLTDWGFEKKTLDQISAKREATMAIITAKANAQRAVQERKTAKETGLKNVEVAKYEKEVEKQRAVVDAQREKEVARIAAEQRVTVAEQAKLEAEQKKFSAAEYKQEQILRGEGDAQYKKLVMEADGALQQRLNAYVKVNGFYAEAIARQKWVPEIQMGDSGGDGNSAQAILDLFMTKTARDISLDMEMRGAVPTSQ